MHITRIGSDFVTISEDNLYDELLTQIPRVHLIKLEFEDPTEDKVKKVLSRFPTTKRFIIDTDIRFYNFILKRTSRKYYVMNNVGDELISFFRRNNKVLLNFFRLSDEQKTFALSKRTFEDILKNVEVIMINKETFHENKEVLEEWNGNVIIK